MQVVAIDASRNRSGGARAHLIGILSHSTPPMIGITKVHLWAYSELLNVIPDKPWLVKHNHKLIEKTIFHQIFWQIFILPLDFRSNGCDIILNTDAGTFSSIKPSVTMSRDMLSYEPGEMQRYGLGFARLRLKLLRYVQNKSLRNCTGSIFLTEYAARLIRDIAKAKNVYKVIPHGVGEYFRFIRPQAELGSYSNYFNVLYISNFDLYKHQWHVVRAIRSLIDSGYNIRLTLVGGGRGKGRNLLDAELMKSDPFKDFVRIHDFVSHDRLIEFFSAADIFVFASSCENMPNTLVEAMAAQLPIACSDRGPMPEVLGSAGCYFNPEDPGSIANAVSLLINDSDLRIKLAREAAIKSLEYSWKRCADETWTFIVESLKRFRG
jgi:glycosyltransferase involved in cell wall biosynthesis